MSELSAIKAENARLKAALITGRTMMEGNDAPEYDRSTNGVTLDFWANQYDEFKDALASVEDILDRQDSQEAREYSE